MESHYDILGAHADEGYAEIKSKYRNAVLALHPDKVLSHQKLSVPANQSADNELVPPAAMLLSVIKELGAEQSLSYTSKDEINAAKFGAGLSGGEDILTRFVRVQEAWEVLRDPNSRAKYDGFLQSQRLALQVKSRGESSRVIGEEIFLHNLDANYADADEGDGEYTYPCRCGDFYVVSQEELRSAGMGFDGLASQETRANGIPSSQKFPVSTNSEQAYLDNGLRGEEAKAGLWSDRTQETPHQTNSLVLPCQSCSLHIRLYDWDDFQ